MNKKPLYFFLNFSPIIKNTPLSNVFVMFILNINDGKYVLRLEVGTQKHFTFYYLLNQRRIK